MGIVRTGGTTTSTGDLGRPIIARTGMPSVGETANPPVGAPLTPAGDTPPRSRDNWLRARLGQFAPVLSNPKSMFGLAILVVFTLLAVFAPLIAPHDPTDRIGRRFVEPGSEFWFGTTGSGQDVFSQFVWGARPSLLVGLLVGLVTTLVAVTVGLSSAYFRGKLDDVLQLVTNVFLIVPGIPLLVVLSGLIGNAGSGWFTDTFSIGSIPFFVLILSFTGWAWGARVMRAQALSLREKDFIAASEISGERSFRIIFREILPNMASIVAGNFIGATVYAIGAQATLEYLALGDPGRVTWGTILYWAGNDNALIQGAWWTVIPAGLSIGLVAFSLALLNSAVDEVTNPRLRATRDIRKGLKRLQGQRTQGRATPVLREAPGRTPSAAPVGD
jgi:peptide/nickel transport system permease protein